MVKYPWWSYPLFWGNMFITSYFILTLLKYLTGKRYELLNDRKNRWTFASRIVTMGHALTSIYLSSKVMMTHDGAGEVVNTDLQNHMLGMSVGYFLYDMIYLNLCEFSWTFNGHHIASLGTVGSQYIFGVGAAHATPLLFCAEVTNPFQIIWDLAKRYRQYPLAKTIYEKLTMPYMYFFIFMRGVVIPTLSLYHNYTWCYEPIDPRLKKFWTFLTIALNSAGFWWIWIMKTRFIDRRKKATPE